MRLKVLYFVFCWFLALTILAQRKNNIRLVPLDSNETISNDETIIYGSFIQRIGMLRSGGASQDIVVINIETKQSYIFNVKPESVNSKKNTFCYKLPQGKYQLVYYIYDYYSWLGGITGRSERIFKNLDLTKWKTRKKIKRGEIDIYSKDRRYAFTINENTITYVGTWDFDKGLASFHNNYEEMNAEIKEIFMKIDFSSTDISIPR